MRVGGSIMHDIHNTIEEEWESGLKEQWLSSLGKFIDSNKILISKPEIKKWLAEADPASMSLNDALGFYGMVELVQSNSKKYSNCPYYKKSEIIKIIEKRKRGN